MLFQERSALQAVYNEKAIFIHLAVHNSRIILKCISEFILMTYSSLCLVPPEVLLTREILRLRRNAKNVTIDCYGYGKPTPSVTWRKDADVIPHVPMVTANDSDAVVQRVFNTSGNPWNVTSRLYVRLDGITYQEAGNYTCEVTNGVGSQGSVNASTEILCKFVITTVNFRW